MKKKKPRYYIQTYDAEKGEFTPQVGVRTGPYTLFGLRKAIRKLRAMGYPCDYSSQHGCHGDPSVAIEKRES
jgi:hypothetical protein